MTENKNMYALMRFLGIISIAISVIIAVILISFFLQILPESMQSLPTLLPFYLCPIGLLTGGLAYIYTKDRLAGWGIVFNSLFTLSPVMLML